VLVDSLIFCLQPLVQPAEPLQISPRLFCRAREPSQYSSICRKSFQSHHLEFRALPCSQGWYAAGQPVPGFLVLAYHHGCPFCPVHVNEPRGEALFREPKNSTYIAKVFFGDLNLRITFTHNGHLDALPGSLGIARSPSSLGPLCLPAPRSAPRQPQSLGWTSRRASVVRRRRTTLLGPWMCLLLLALGPIRTELLQSLCMAALRRSRPAASRVLGRGLRLFSPPRPLLSSPRTILFRCL
jgi:hypothetical protein